MQNCCNKHSCSSSNIWLLAHSDKLWAIVYNDWQWGQISKFWRRILWRRTQVGKWSWITLNHTDRVSLSRIESSKFLDTVRQSRDESFMTILLCFICPLYARKWSQTALCRHLPFLRRLSLGADPLLYYVLDAQHLIQPVPHRQHTVSNVRNESAASERTWCRT